MDFPWPSLASDTLADVFLVMQIEAHFPFLQVLGLVCHQGSEVDKVRGAPAAVKGAFAGLHASESLPGSPQVQEVVGIPSVIESTSLSAAAVLPSDTSVRELVGLTCLVVFGHLSVPLCFGSQCGWADDNVA